MNTISEALTVERPANRMAPIMWSSVLGSMAEWYDFLIYGLASGLVFNTLFFPRFDPIVGTMAAFGSYAVGFLARPLGGIIFGHFGDTIGRKTMLTMTMLIMGIGTFLVGCLPTYKEIGFMAPLILISLRFLQGVGIGGEWAGAALMVIENAPDHKRGLLGGLVQLGFPLGIISSTTVFLSVASMPEASFMSWGWRIPFLFSAVLVVIGLFVRLRLSETPAFKEVQATQAVASRPLFEVVVKHPRLFLISVGMKVSEIGLISLITSFSFVYGTRYLGLSRTTILYGIAIAACFELVTIPLSGYLSDRVGRKPLCYISAILSAVMAFPLFWMLQSNSVALMLLALILIVVLGHSIMFGVEATYFAELFGTRVRYSGASLGFQVAACISGGFAPMIATYLLGKFNATWPISVFLIGLATITLVASVMAPETAGKELS